MKRVHSLAGDVLHVYQARCVRVSKCWELLFTCGERRTQKMLRCGARRTGAG
jgi:hypothetical protein